MSDLYLLDTNIISHALDEWSCDYSKVWNFLNSLSSSAISVSVITLAEIEYGLRTAPEMIPERQAAVRSALGKFPLIRDITVHTVGYYAELRAELFRQYSPTCKRGRLTKKRVEDLIEPTTAKELGIKESDLWIAAQSVEWNCVLVTNDAMRPIIGLKTNPPIRPMSLK